MLDTPFWLCYNENEFEVLFIFAGDREQGFGRKRAEPERGENEQNPKRADEEQKEKKYADSFSAA